MTASTPKQWDWIRVGALALAVGLLGLTLRTARRPGATGPAVTAAAFEAAPVEAEVYGGRLMPGWQDWSWAKHDIQSAEVIHQGRMAIKMEPAPYTGVYLHHDGLDTRPYKSLWLWVHGGKTGGQQLDICAADTAKKFGPKLDLGTRTSEGRIPANKWTLAIIPLAKLNADRRTVTGFVIQERAGKAQGACWFADIKLVGDAPGTQGSSGAVTVSVDTAKDVHPISPYIYGLAHASPETVRELRIAAHRWGGNPNTRHNWEINAWNHARDWQFSNYGDKNATTPGIIADGFVAGNRRDGAASFLTVPTIGWVAKDHEDASRSLDVPKEGGPPAAPGSDAIPGYNPSRNRQRTSVRSFARKRGPFQDPPDLRDGAVYQDEWVAHLVKKFGKAAEGGVRFYAMDNEADLWDGTHTDVHPVRMGYDDLLSNFLEYATAIKAVDPTAQVTGPVSWGWTGYFHSPRDRDNWNNRLDRKAHGDVPFIPWFLEQARRHDQRTGKRTLDVLDVHFYPQGTGVYGNQTDPATNALRLRSVRALWDPSYKDESWIGEPVMLLPRMKEWIDRNYPGTRLGLTEWNFGADNTVNGALAVAEALGVFGRENLYLANYWTSPKERTPGWYAFKIFRNADGKGTGFGERSVSARSSSPDEVSCFASLDAGGNPALLLVNKQPGRDASVTVRISHGRPLASAARWAYGETDPSGIQRLPDVPVKQNAVSLQLPRSSITLLHLK